jgi:hypothetical protein
VSVSNSRYAVWPSSAISSRFGVRCERSLFTTAEYRDRQSVFQPLGFGRRGRVETGSRKFGKAECEGFQDHKMRSTSQDSNMEGQVVLFKGIRQPMCRYRR